MGGRCGGSGAQVLQLLVGHQRRRKGAAQLMSVRQTAAGEGNAGHGVCRVTQAWGSAAACRRSRAARRERMRQLQLIGHGSHVRQLGKVGLRERAWNGASSSWSNRERHQPAFDRVGGVGGSSLHWSAGPHAVCCQAERLDDQLLTDLNALDRPARVCCAVRQSLSHGTRGHVADVLALQRIEGSAPRAQHAHSSSVLRSVCRCRALRPALFAKSRARSRLGLHQHEQHARRHCRAAEKLLC